MAQPQPQTHQQQQHQQQQQPKIPTRKEAEDESVVPVPQAGDRAPSLGDQVHFPSDKPVLVVFLRHCGCPFAEKTFRTLSNLSNHHPEIQFIAISQSTQEDTDKWIVQVGGEWDVLVLADPDRTLFHAWGLGLSSTWYALNPVALWNTWKLGTDEGIWNRSSNSGSRWQIGGAFAVDRDGLVTWAKPAQSADEVPDFKEALRALGRR
ncbi:hypothetical protein B0J18DRAFT_429201 [Chaetomium sp. MPI-SDFR-AT-0129]|nr:hypothetical protein B0J18DRAFT_429201 [Chaetomium sp. MPI-SDFR-AT-0129]